MLHLALIGVGAWGKNYISTIRNFTDCRIKYLCANTSNSLGQFSSDYIKTTDYNELFFYSDIDGVIVATPNATHYEILQALIKRGFNVLIEKPIVENYSQARKLITLQQKSGSKILVGHTYLFDPAYIKTKELVKGIGQFRYLAYEGTNNGPFRKNTSTLWDIGPHALSLCLDISQKKPIQISAWAVDSLRPHTGYYDFSYIKLTFQDQTEAYIKISWMFPIKKRELVIIGRKNGLVYDAVAEKRITYYKDMIPSKKNIDLRRNTTQVSYPPYDSYTPLELEVKEFIASIKNKNNKNRSDLQFGTTITKLLMLADESIKQNGISIPIS